MANIISIVKSCQSTVLNWLLRVPLVAEPVGKSSYKHEIPQVPPPSSPDTWMLDKVMAFREIGDPWDWDVDRVIQEISTSDRSWEPTYRTPPDAALISAAFKSNDVDGCTLLTIVDGPLLVEWGLASLGQRGYVLDGIRKLRRKSAQWLNSTGGFTEGGGDANIEQTILREVRNAIQKMKFASEFNRVSQLGNADLTTAGTNEVFRAADGDKLIFEMPTNEFEMQLNELRFKDMAINDPPLFKRYQDLIPMSLLASKKDQAPEDDLSDNNGERALDDASQDPDVPSSKRQKLYTTTDELNQDLPHGLTSAAANYDENDLPAHRETTPNLIASDSPETPSSDRKRKRTSPLEDHERLSHDADNADANTNEFYDTVEDFQLADEQEQDDIADHLALIDDDGHSSDDTNEDSCDDMEDPSDNMRIPSDHMVMVLDSTGKDLNDAIGDDIPADTIVTVKKVPKRGNLEFVRNFETEELAKKKAWAEANALPSYADLHLAVDADISTELAEVGKKVPKRGNLQFVRGFDTEEIAERKNRFIPSYADYHDARNLASDSSQTSDTSEDELGGEETFEVDDPRLRQLNDDYDQIMDTETPDDQGRLPVVSLSSGHGDGLQTTPHDQNLDHPQHYESSKPVMEQASATSFSNTSRPAARFHVLHALPRHSMPVDEHFYAGTGVGEEIVHAVFTDGDGDFSSVTNPLHNPLARQYVARMVHHSLWNVNHHTVKINDATKVKYTIIEHYKTGILTGFGGRPSWTVFFHEKDGKLHEKRVSVSSRERLIQCLDAEARNLVWGESDTPMLPGQNSNTPHDDFDHLLHWENIPGGDTIVPALGESGDEYDSALMDEVARDGKLSAIGVIQNLKGTSRKAPLPYDEVARLLDQRLAKHRVSWNTVQAKKRERRAYRLWNKGKAGREGTSHMRILATQKDLKRLLSRMSNVREKFLEEDYSSAKQVTSCAGVLFATVESIEDLRWQISILGLENAPPKPPATKTKKAKKPTASKKQKKKKWLDEDGDNDGDDEGDDDMSDFIIPNEKARTQSRRDAITATSDSPHLPLAETSRTPSEEIKAETGGAQNSDDDMSDIILPSNESPDQDIIDLTTLPSSPPSKEVIDLITPEKSATPHREFSAGIPKFRLTTNPTLPKFSDVVAINSFSNEYWIGKGDHIRLLIKAYYNMQPEHRTDVFKYMDIVNTEKKLWHEMSTVLRAIVRGDDHASNTTEDEFIVLRQYLRLFYMFANCQFLTDWDGVDDEDKAVVLVNILEEQMHHFPAFYKNCALMPGTFASYYSTFNSSTSSGAFNSPASEDIDIDDEDEDPIKPFQNRRVKNTDSIDDEFPFSSPHNKRKNPVREDATARSRREHDRMRQSQQEARRLELQEMLVKSGRDELARVVINATDDPAKSIQVHPAIAGAIKPHQIKGVRFMWSQIVANGQEDAISGCILAHTMGLGKTMQAITLLVAIADAASNIDPDVSNQIPESLRVSRTLVIVPAFLVHNWIDELLTWAPEGILGEYRDIDSTLPPSARRQRIADWYEEGGVLVIGYSIFRDIISTDKEKSPEWEQTAKYLLQGPNIVVADEAHTLKNDSSAVTRATTGFRTKSRIALTGSPLSNALGEYHAMFNFIAPGYLGPRVEFKAKYEEPIQNGLYGDSNPWEERNARKMLRVLEQDIDPKIDRANISVLADAGMPQKREFIIKVSLTEVQTEAYKIYVQSALSEQSYSTSKSGDAAQTSIWSWMDILGCLCNHPAIFKAKLLERKKDAKKPKRNAAAAPGDDSGEWKMGVSRFIFDKEMEYLNQIPDIESISHSHKASILMEILDHAKKAKDKTLIFSVSIPTLDFLEKLLKSGGRSYLRIDGGTKVGIRQEMTKKFNTGETDIFLISAKAGGLGLNLQGANRVVIYDFKWNPTVEEQAVGRAYRIGQTKETFVYRFIAGGTFEESIQNKAIFKTQLASRVIDKKASISYATKKAGDYLFEPKHIPQQDLTSFMSHDPSVLDNILATQSHRSSIRAIVQTDAFERPEVVVFDAEDEKEILELQNEEKVRRTNPEEYQRLVTQRQARAFAQPPGQPQMQDQVRRTAQISAFDAPAPVQAPENNMQVAQREVHAQMSPPAREGIVSQPALPTPKVNHSPVTASSSLSQGMDPPVPQQRDAAKRDASPEFEAPPSAKRVASMGSERLPSAQLPSPSSPARPPSAKRVASADFQAPPPAKRAAVASPSGPIGRPASDKRHSAASTSRMAPVTAGTTYEEDDEDDGPIYPVNRPMRTAPLGPSTSRPVTKGQKATSKTPKSSQKPGKVLQNLFLPVLKSLGRDSSMASRLTEDIRLLINQNGVTNTRLALLQASWTALDTDTEQVRQLITGELTPAQFVDSLRSSSTDNVPKSSSGSEPNGNGQVRSPQVSTSIPTPEDRPSTPEAPRARSPIKKLKDKSAMYTAMARQPNLSRRQPVQNLRTPVTRTATPKTKPFNRLAPPSSSANLPPRSTPSSSRTSLRKDDENAMNRVNAKRRSRGDAEMITSPHSSSRPTRLPAWADDTIKNLQSGSDHHRQKSKSISSRASSSSRAPPPSSRSAERKKKD